jgi:DnaJ-class molecular chaperone
MGDGATCAWAMTPEQIKEWNASAGGEVTTTQFLEPCPWCDGTGGEPMAPCQRCNGDGEILVTRREERF